MTDKVDQKDFLSRWSTRKLAEAESEKTAAPVALNETDDLEVENVDEAVAPPPDLPDVETLNAESDFTAFLGDNVPRDISRLAFKKLWRSDPVLANIDGLNDYDDDFSMAGKVTEIFKSAYQVGKGYQTEEDLIVDEEELDDETADGAPLDVANAKTPDEALPEEPADEGVTAEPAELSAEAAVEMDPLTEGQPVKS